MHNIRTNFDKILVVIKDILKDEINDKGNYKRRGTVPKFSDIDAKESNKEKIKKEKIYDTFLSFALIELQYYCDFNY